MRKINNCIFALFVFLTASITFVCNAGPKEIAQGLGIEFSDVTPSHIENWRKALDPSLSNFSFANLPPEDFRDTGYSLRLKNEEKIAQYKSIISQYLQKTQRWFLSRCLLVDMNKLNQGQWDVTGIRYKLPKTFYRGTPEEEVKKILKSNGETLGDYYEDSFITSDQKKCVFWNKKNHKNIKLEDYQNPLLSLSLNSETYFNLEEYSNGNSQYKLLLANVETNLISGKNQFTSTNPDPSDVSRNTYLSPELLLIGPFIVPMKGHFYVKSGPTPVGVMSDDGKDITIIDFGELLLSDWIQKKSSVTLTSVLGDYVLNKIKAEDTEKIGTLLSKGHQAGDYVDWSNLPITQEYWNYDRLPAGSIHFMGNAVWNDSAAQTESTQAFFVHLDSAEQLLTLYRSGDVFVNTYDHHVLEIDVETNRHTYFEPVRSTNSNSFLSNHYKNESDLDDYQPVYNIPTDQFMSHEIILSTEKARELWRKGKTKVYHQHVWSTQNSTESSPQ